MRIGAYDPIFGTLGATHLVDVYLVKFHLVVELMFGQSADRGCGCGCSGIAEQLENLIDYLCSNVVHTANILR